MNIMKKLPAGKNRMYIYKQTKNLKIVNNMSLNIQLLKQNPWLQ